MSSSSADEVGVEEYMQEIREQRIVIRFDYLRAQDGPQRGVVILRFLGFGVVTFVRIDPDEARVGDVAIEVAHNGFYTRIEVWLKVKDGARGWVSTSELQTQYYYTSYWPCIE
ncbi:unnamed protein product [Sphagnum jensenii]|uniref:SH3 domain-containing protein n=1 Tax=Sphagnum jensenii TaxID=128206 RepID=A0ABP1BLF8_9BRYO